MGRARERKWKVETRPARTSSTAPQGTTGLENDYRDENLRRKTPLGKSIWRPICHLVYHLVYFYATWYNTWYATWYNTWYVFNIGYLFYAVKS